MFWDLLLLLILLLETRISPKKTTIWGGISSQIDYILVRRSDSKLVSGIKVIPGEEVVNRHWKLVSDIE